MKVKKSKSVKIYFTPEALEEIKKKAKDRKMTMSKYIKTQFIN